MLRAISELGYECVAITLDHYALNPFRENIHREINEISEILQQHSLDCVIETGARFLLNPRMKHEPTLISPSQEKRDIRIDFLKKSIDIAKALGGEAVSFWSGIKHKDVDQHMAWEWLVAGCKEVTEYASRHSVPLAFEPEPGMLVENLTQYEALSEIINDSSFGLTLDTGHAFITEKETPEDCIRKYINEIKTIHLEDMKKDDHQHLFFGEGGMDFNKIIKTLTETNYPGSVNIELSRHSHNAVETARQSIAFIENIYSQFGD